ncbi:MAG: hypothetical protein IPK96_21405 [Flammeovirgaceae bacterium]|nr:hypothetical protein [Flammeovirgaceae bacterium]
MIVAPGGNDQLYVLPPTNGTENTALFVLEQTEDGPVILVLVVILQPHNWL